MKLALPPADPGRSLSTAAPPEIEHAAAGSYGRPAPIDGSLSDIRHAAVPRASVPVRIENRPLRWPGVVSGVRPGIGPCGRRQEHGRDNDAPRDHLHLIG